MNRLERKALSVSSRMQKFRVYVSETGQKTTVDRAVVMNKVSMNGGAACKGLLSGCLDRCEAESCRVGLA